MCLAGPSGSLAEAGTKPQRMRATWRSPSAFRRITLAKRIGVTVSSGPAGAFSRSASCTSVPQDIIWVNLPHMTCRDLPHDLQIAEEEPDLVCGRLGCVRAMHRIGLDVLSQILADRTRRRLGRIGRTHDFAVLGDG